MCIIIIVEDFYNKFPCIIVDSFKDITLELINNYKYDQGKVKNIEKYLVLDNITEFIKTEINK